jgi:hypothetical protein
MRMLGLVMLATGIPAAAGSLGVARAILAGRSLIFGPGTLIGRRPVLGAGIAVVVHVQ